jgi:hypothetical protein
VCRKSFLVLCTSTMCALASLQARAAARVRALEAGAPELAAAATCPLRLIDLLRLNAAALLGPLVVPEIFQIAAVEGGLTLREARLVYEGAGTAIATLVGIARRFVWRDQVAAQGLSRDGRAKAHVQELVTRMLQTLGLLLACPFYVFEGPERRMAIREAAQR